MVVMAAMPSATFVIILWIAIGLRVTGLGGGV